METFVVRIWRPADAADAAPGDVADLRGIVEHVATGQSDPFTGPDTLIALLVSGLRRPSRLRRTTEDAAEMAEGGKP